MQYLVNAEIECGAVAPNRKLGHDEFCLGRNSMPGPYFRDWRKYRGLTLASVEEQSGLSAAQVSRMERGLSDYSRRSLESLSSVYRCRPGDLLSTDPQNSLVADVLDLFERIDPAMWGLALRALTAFAEASEETSPKKEAR